MGKMAKFSISQNLRERSPDVTNFIYESIIQFVFLNRKNRQYDLGFEELALLLALVWLWCCGAFLQQDECSHGGCCCCCCWLSSWSSAFAPFCWTLASSSSAIFLLFAFPSASCLLSNILA